MDWYWLIHDGTGSVKDSYGWYLVVLGQLKALLVDTILCKTQIYKTPGPISSLCPSDVHGAVSIESP